MKMMDVQVQEMKSMSNAIRKLEGTSMLIFSLAGSYEIFMDFGS